MSDEVKVEISEGSKITYIDRTIGPSKNVYLMRNRHEKGVKMEMAQNRDLCGSLTRNVGRD